MPFGSPRTPRSNPSPRRNGAPVLSVGRRVFINCPADPGRGVTLTDDAGRSTSRLADGVEVEIVAWRPRSGTGTRYRVRSTAERAEGWLAVGDLRPIPQPAPPAAPPAPAGREVPDTSSRDASRKFGQRR